MPLTYALTADASSNHALAADALTTDALAADALTTDAAMTHAIHMPTNVRCPSRPTPNVLLE